MQDKQIKELLGKQKKNISVTFVCDMKSYESSYYILLTLYSFSKKVLQ